MVGEAVQLSVAVALGNDTFALQPLVKSSMFGGQVMVGACVSLIVTLKEHVAELLAASVARNVTTVVVPPPKKTEPERGPVI